MSQATRRPTALVIDDDAAIRELLRRLLGRLGLEPTLAEDGRVGLDLALRDPPFNVVLLDLNLPGVHGVDVLGEIRARGVVSPVIVISGHLEADARRAVAASAMMVLTKPFDEEELAIWVGRALEATSAGQRSEIRRVGDIEIDLERSSVMRNGESVPLTRLDFRLLVKLTDRAGVPVSSAELHADLWDDVMPESRQALEQEVSRLRRKLDQAGGPSHIESVRGEGYRFVPHQTSQRDPNWATLPSTC
jgi:two-component system OmpR family response regulator